MNDEKMKRPSKTLRKEALWWEIETAHMVGWHPISWCLSVRAAASSSRPPARSGLSLGGAAV